MILLLILPLGLAIWRLSPQRYSENRIYGFARSLATAATLLIPCAQASLLWSVTHPNPDAESDAGLIFVVSVLVTGLAWLITLWLWLWTRPTRPEVTGTGLTPDRHTERGYCLFLESRPPMNCELAKIVTLSIPVCLVWLIGAIHWDDDQYAYLPPTLALLLAILTSALTWIWTYLSQYWSQAHEPDSGGTGLGRCE